MTTTSNFKAQVSLPSDTEVRVTAARDKARPLQHLQMLGDRRLAHGERFGQLVHRRLAERKASEDGAPGRIGKGSEGSVETGRGKHFHNRSVLELVGY